MNNLLVAVVGFVLLVYPAVNALPAAPVKKTSPSSYARLIKKKQDRFLAFNAELQRKRQLVLEELREVVDGTKVPETAGVSDSRARELEEAVYDLTRKIEDNCLNYTVFLETTLSRLSKERISSSRRPFYRW